MMVLLVTVMAGSRTEIAALEVLPEDVVVTEVPEAGVAGILIVMMGSGVVDRIIDLTTIAGRDPPEGPMMIG